jgi:hypothetical protein
MTDVHLRVLRAAAARRARQLRADGTDPAETAADSTARRASLEGLASRARDQLSAAAARRRRSTG